ncbi:MAG: TIGR01459 family HAD-type hydrolase [Rhodospirillales bacterium]|nr:TIGR01459 family HAD-type hydrolase [Rhodospirillales bacterium]
MIPPRLQPAIPAAPRPLAGLRDITDRYDGFVLDLWGCLHDGVTAYPGVIDAMRRLKGAGKRVLVLTNAPRRADVVADSMLRFGLTADLYDAVLSSGEAAWQALARRTDPWHARLGRRCFHIGPERDYGMLDGNDLTVAGDVANADFILTTGPRDDSLGVGDHEETLAAAAARRLPMVCANPDLEVLRGDTRLVCAGALAARYGELGGDIAYHGKPYRSIYDRALELLGVADRERVLAVGDGLKTDIAGAAGAGLASAFIAGGIHGTELGVRMGETPDVGRAAAFAARFGTGPTYLLPEMRW